MPANEGRAPVDDHHFVMRVGRLFKRKREEIGISLRELEKVPSLQMNASQINRLENGQILRPAAQDIHRLAKFFGISEEELFGEEPEVMAPSGEGERFLRKCQVFVAMAKENDLQYAETFLTALTRYLREKRELEEERSR